MKNKIEETVGICGLFCKTCPSFADGVCQGCLSDHVAEACAECLHGFRECAKKLGVVRCSECSEAPCERLWAFKDAHIVNGISHHETIIDDVLRQKEIGVEAWVKEQEEKNRCPICGTLVIWCEEKCRCCGHVVHTCKNSGIE